MEGERQQEAERKRMMSMKDAKDDYFESLERKLTEEKHVCEDCGKPMLTEKEIEELANLEEGKKHGNSKVYDKCWKGCRKVAGKKRGEPGSCKCD